MRTQLTLVAFLNHHSQRLMQLGLLGVVVAVAAGLRFSQLATLPTGLSADEIWFALDALQLRQGVQACCPLYFGLPFGGHPLYVYLTVVAQHLGAHPPISGRIVSAVLGVGSVGMAFWAFQSLGSTVARGSQALWIGLAGAFALATNFADVIWSRVGLETHLAGALAVPVMWLSWLAFERYRHKLAIAAGLVLGLSMYGYVAADSFMLAILLYAGVRWMSASQVTRRRIVPVALVLLATAAVVYAPLALTLLRSPGQFVSHLLSASHATRAGGLGAVALRLVVNIGRTLAAISLTGDSTYVAHSGRPLFGPIAALFFWIGALRVVQYAWHRRSDAQLALAWAICASLPAVLSDETPHFGRWTGAYPALAYMAGVGVVTAWSATKRIPWFRGPLGHKTLSLAFVLAGLFSLQRTAAAYFGGWGTQLPPYEMNVTAPRLSAEQAIAYSASATVYVTPTGDGLVQPVFDLLLAGTPVRPIDARACLPLAWNDPEPTYYGVFTLADKTTLDRLRGFYPIGRLTAEYLDAPNPWLYSAFFEVPAGAQPKLPIHTVPTEFAGDMHLLGYFIPLSDITPGGEIEVRLYWQVEAPTAQELVAFVHFGQVGTLQPLAQHDGPPCSAAYPTTLWDSDEVYPDHHLIRLPADLPPGEYAVRAGLYSWPDQKRQPITNTVLPRATPAIVQLTTITVRAP